MKVKQTRVAGGELPVSQCRQGPALRGHDLGSGIEWKPGRCHEPGGRRVWLPEATWWRQKQPLPSHSLYHHGSAAEGAIPGCWEPHFGARQTLHATLSSLLFSQAFAGCLFSGVGLTGGLGGGQTLETPTTVGNCFLQGGRGRHPGEPTEAARSLLLASLLAGLRQSRPAGCWIRFFIPQESSAIIK